MRDTSHDEHPPLSPPSGVPILGYSGPREPHTLKAYLAFDFAYARDWIDLQKRLLEKGYTLAPAGTGLVLRTTAGKRLCAASELGQSYARLIRRFGRAYPNHTHANVARKNTVQKVLAL